MPDHWRGMHNRQFILIVFKILVNLSKFRNRLNLSRQLPTSLTNKVSHNERVYLRLYINKPREKIAHSNNNTQISLGMTPRKREVEARKLKAANMQTKKIIEKELLSYIGEKYVAKRCK